MPFHKTNPYYLASQSVSDSFWNLDFRKVMLSGYRVLDLTDEKGWLCGKLLAGMGADVIRVDKPGGDLPAGFLNAGKRSITIDIEQVEGKKLFKRLAKTADVLVESFNPGFLKSLGLDYGSLRRLNPRLIFASITGFGQSGPYRDYKSSNLVAGALGGRMSVCGDSGTPPLKPYGAQAYNTASLFAANGILLALMHRHDSGKGQLIDISVHECVAATLDHVLVRFFYEGVVAERKGSLYWNNAFRVFPCRDGYILLTLFHQWETLVEWLDSEGMAQNLRDSMWLDPQVRMGNIDHIIAVLEQWTKSHTVAELVEKGQLMRFPWAEVAAIPEVVNNRQLNERGFFIESDGKKYPGAPCKLSASSWKTVVHIPTPGEHNGQIFGELGLTEKEMKSLSRKRII